jgi:amino acid transporter
MHAPEQTTAPSSPPDDPVILLPTAGQKPLTEADLEVLRRIGQHWRDALGGARISPEGLPVDPDLKSRASEVGRTDRFARVVDVDGFEPVHPGELVATEEAVKPPLPEARVLFRLRRLVLGPPLATSALVEERLTKLKALAVLSSDALSSVAYGTEAMLSVLILAGTGALSYSLPIGAVIVVLMIAVGLSYRQTIRAYPRGGGSYIVARDNLGDLAGLTAAAGLMTDYVLTVAVSVSAGAAAITSAVPYLRPALTPMALLFIGVILWGNLRGLRQSGSMFAVPTYAFVAGILALIAVGLFQAGGRGWTPLPAPAVAPVEGLSFFLILRAFASGSSAMTGVEAIADGVPAFQPPEWRNARTTLTWMITLLVVMFAGVTLLAHFDGIVPRPEETVLSQITRHTFGGGAGYLYVQVTTMLVLVLAANTAFNDFPRLLFFLARDRYAPRMFLRMGDRLSHSNGMVVLTVAAVTLVIAFRAQTDSLISLYAVGVFLSFTLSQTGMIVRWWRRREPGWRRSLPVNAGGAALSAAVLVVIAVAKFTEGAWIVVVLVPTLVATFRRIHLHYGCVEAATEPKPPEHPSHHLTSLLAGRRSAPDGQQPAPEAAEAPDEIQHLALVPVADLNLPALRALAYAVSLGQPVLALHISPDDQDAERIQKEWDAWGRHVPLEVVISPYRLTVIPIVNYVRVLLAQSPRLTLTVVLPDLVVGHWWQAILHNRIPLKLRIPLRRWPGIVLTTVPFHLPPC